MIHIVYYIFILLVLECSSNIFNDYSSYKDEQIVFPVKWYDIIESII